MADFTAGLAFIIIYFVVIFGISITMYLFEAFGLYRMGQRLGFKNPWLAFVPVANVYALGKVAEQYVKNDGKPSAKFSKILLTLNIIILAIAVLFVVLAVVSAVMFTTATTANIVEGSVDESMMGGIAIIIPLLLGYLALIGIAIAQSVVYYIALWRIFAIYDNNNATVFLVLSIFISFLYPIFLFVLRNKEPKLTPQERFNQI